MCIRDRSEEVIKDFNRTIIRLGEDLHKPVIATGDVHFTEPEDAIYRTVLQAVSYTHLDVYKRQLRATLPRQSAVRRRAARSCV